VVGEKVGTNSIHIRNNNLRKRDSGAGRTHPNLLPGRQSSPNHRRPITAPGFIVLPKIRLEFT
jgi:hypothetical protein